MDVPDPAAIYSIHNLALKGADLGTPIGQYFSPSVLARVLKRQSLLRSDIPFSISVVKQGIINMSHLRELLVASKKALIILISLRLGADTLNEQYSPLIKASLSCPLCIGIVGGQASRAYYIAGYQDEALLYLDPHQLRPAALDVERLVESEDLHARAVCELPITKLDPTVLFGFLSKSPNDLDLLKNTLLGVAVPMPLFSIIP